MIFLLEKQVIERNFCFPGGAANSIYQDLDSKSLVFEKTV